MRRRIIKDIILAVSIANLCFLQLWTVMLFPSFLTPSYTATELLGLMVAVVLLAGAFWILFAIGRTVKDDRLWRLVRWLPFAALIPPLNYLRRLFLFSPQDLLRRFGTIGCLVLAAVIGVTIVWALWKWNQFLLSVAENCLVGLIGFALVSSVAMVRGVYSRLAEPPATVHAGVRSAPAATPGSRVLWLVFDELDQRVAFVDRPAALRLRELDRFRAASFYATAAHSPADETDRSILAMMTGRLVSNVTPSGDSEMIADFGGNRQRERVGLQPNVFSDVQHLGLNAAVAGWGFPYCRVWGGSLAKCWWQPALAPATHPDRSLIRQTAESFVALMPWASRQEHLDKYLSILDAAKTMATDASLALVLVHWPVPHQPPIYDRQTARCRVRFFREERNGYLDNLVLADRTLGEMRKTMEAAGLWDQTTVIVTADHPWRTSTVLDGKSDERVPFLVKLAGQDRMFVYDRPFNTVLSRGLIAMLERSRVKDPEKLANWIDQHRWFGQSPTYRQWQ